MNQENNLLTQLSAALPDLNKSEAKVANAILEDPEAATRSSIAVLAAAASGNKKFFLGTDSAPHAKHKKENACGCAGCYSAWSAIELYAEVFEQLGAIDKLEGFASHYGADFYGLPRNTTTMTLVKRTWTVPEQVTLADGTNMVPFFAGQTLQWKLEKAFQG